MATLADINNSLQTQSGVLESVAKNTDRTGDAINKFLSVMEVNRKRQLEADLESKKPVSQRISETASRASDAASRTGSALADKFSLPAVLLTGPGLAALGTALFGGLAKRGIPAAIGVTFADEIGRWVESQTGSNALGEAAERATIGGSFGLLLGRRFALLGSIIGGVATDANVELLTDIGKNLEEAAEKLGLPIPSLENLQGGITKGLQGIKDLTEGDFSGFADNLIPALSLLAGTALLIAPGTFMTGVTKLFKFARTPLGARLILIAGAVAAGTFAYDKFVDKLIGEDGSGDITSEDLIGGAAIAGGATVAAIATKRAISRRGMSADEIAEQRERNARTPKPAIKIVKRDGKEFVQSKDGKLYARGTPQADMIETRGGTQAKPSTKWYSKFPRITSLPKVGPLGALATLLTGAQVAEIMNGPGSKEEKIEQLGPLIGGLLGMAGGAALLGALGSVVPFLGTGIGAAAGATLGFFGGEFLGKKVAAYMLGEEVNQLPPVPEGFTVRQQSAQMDMMSNRSYSAPSSSISRPDMSGTLTPMAPAMSSSSGALGNVIMGSGNTTITNSSPQALMMNNGGAVDTNHDIDMLASSYRFP